MIRISAILIIALCSNFHIAAQNNIIMYGSRAGTISHMMNPALVPGQSLVFSMPLVGSNSVCYLSSIKPSDLLVDNGDGTSTVDIPYFLTTLRPNNPVSLDVDLNLLYVGFNIGQMGFASFGLDHHTSVNANFSDTFLEFFGRGNAAFLDRQIQFSKEELGIIQYQNIHLDYAHFINDKWTVALRFNWLKGASHAQLERWNASLYTDSGSAPAYTVDATVDFGAVATGLLAEALDSSGMEDFSFNDFWGTGNGVGFDFGTVFNVNKNWQVSAAINNIPGTIRWKARNVKKYRIAGNGTFTFNGFQTSVGEEDEEDFDEKWDALEEEIETAFEIEETNAAYTSKIGPSITLAGTFQNDDGQHAVSVVYRGVSRIGTLRHGLGLTYHFVPWNFLELSAAYSWLQASPANFGVGTVVRMGPVQFHAYTNDIRSLIDPENARQVHLRFGVNFTFGTLKKPKKEKPAEEEPLPRAIEEYF